MIEFQQRLSSASLSFSTPPEAGKHGDDTKGLKHQFECAIYKLLITNY